MRIILISTPRAGSHARCSQFDNPLYECLNCEDLLLPRDPKGNINYSILNETLLKLIDNANWESAWEFRPAIPHNHYLVDYDENLLPRKIYSYPDKEEFLQTINKRIAKLQAIDSWCVKIMRYHGLTKDQISKLISISDKAIRLQRKDKVAQSISQYLATHNNSWHNAQGNAGDIDYENFKDTVNGVINEDKWIETNYKHLPVEYYEDLDFTNSATTKNNVKLNYDLEKCKEIVNNVQ